MLDPFGFDKEVWRHRCEGCGRPMRVVTRQFHRLPLREHCCCADCLHKVTLRRANERRRVRHYEMACEVCGEMFVPKQSTAKTCSNRCRQKLHRERHKVVAGMIGVLVLALLHAPAQAQQVEQERATAMAQALPYPNPRDQNCASGYTSSGGYCRPIDDRSAPAIANPGGQCPSGWTSSGNGCVNRSRARSSATAEWADDHDRHVAARHHRPGGGRGRRHHHRRIDPDPGRNNRPLAPAEPAHALFRPAPWPG